MRKIIHSMMPKNLIRRMKYYNWIKHLFFHKESYLIQTGYLKSSMSWEPIDNENNPIPWMNYSVVDFISKRLNKRLNVFEYGSGYSTMYLAKLVNSVTSVEHDKEWYTNINQRINQISNVTLFYATLGSGYIQGIKNLSSKNQRYEIVLVDGRERVACAIFALDYLTSDGILILDDSDRNTYANVFSVYSKNGYKELSIGGLKPNGLGISHTTIFYKPNNVLNI